MSHAYFSSVLALCCGGEVISVVCVQCCINKRAWQFHITTIENYAFALTISSARKSRSQNEEKCVESQRYVHLPISDAFALLWKCNKICTLILGITASRRQVTDGYKFARCKPWKLGYALTVLKHDPSAIIVNVWPKDVLFTFNPERADQYCYFQHFIPNPNDTPLIRWSIDRLLRLRSFMNCICVVRHSLLFFLIFVFKKNIPKVFSFRYVYHCCHCDHHRRFSLSLENLFLEVQHLCSSCYSDRYYLFSSNKVPLTLFIERTF